MHFERPQKCLGLSHARDARPGPADSWRQRSLPRFGWLEEFSRPSPVCFDIGCPLRPHPGIFGRGIAQRRVLLRVHGYGARDETINEDGSDGAPRSA